MAFFYEPRFMYDITEGGGGGKVVTPDKAKVPIPSTVATAATAGALTGLATGVKGLVDSKKPPEIAPPTTGIFISGEKDDDPKKPKGRGGYYSAPAAKPQSLGQKYDASTKLNITPEDQAKLLKQRQQLSSALAGDTETPEIDRVNKYDKTELVNNLEQQIETARQQYNNQINYTMDTQARDLNRALADAQSQYQTQQNQVTANEMNALDNAALYAEARGDRGGIGQSQYNSIMNTAAQNRLAISQAQTKAAQDVARQITDLRSQGEFDKADKALELAQTKLSELRQIEQFAANYNLSVDQMNTAIAEWEYEYEQAAKQFQVSTELQLTQLTGMFSNGMSTYDARKETQKANADLALSLIEMGVQPNKLSTAQLNALANYYGMNQSAINNYFKRANKDNY